MNGARWRAWLAAVLIFCFGLAVGGTLATFAGIHFLRRVLVAPPTARGLADRVADRVAADLTRTLALTPEQSTQVRTMLEQSAANVKAIRARSAADLEAELRNSTAKIAAQLPPDKRADFYRVIAQRFDRLGLTPPSPEPGK